MVVLPRNASPPNGDRRWPPIGPHYWRIYRRNAARSRQLSAWQSQAGRISDVRGPNVIAHDRGEQHRVEAVQRASVRAEQAARVLGLRLALDERLEQVAD